MPTLPPSWRAESSGVLCCWFSRWAEAPPCSSSSTNPSCNSDGFSPLHVASLHGHAPLASRLLRGGARLDACTALQATPLHLACQNQHTQ
ncbi:hypothetical protein CRUP_005374, partial [Coryphaenoides rupestris]